MCDVKIKESPIPISIIVNQFVGKALVTNTDNTLHVQEQDLGIVAQVLDAWKCVYEIE